jgi:hypothetical protein
MRKEMRKPTRRSILLSQKKPNISEVRSDVDEEKNGGGYGGVRQVKMKRP